MATSPNFGWTEPDDTSLVKDGAAAIRTLGNAIDSSMGDLLGGTTGQVLAKASNTNMDFTWVAQDDSNAIQNAIVDAKGDLIAATANDTPARLAVGNNGETLVADSSATTGLRWQGSQSAGKNIIINGGFDIWQRATSSATNGGYTTADRWTRDGANCTTSQQTTGAPTGSRYVMRNAFTSASGAYVTQFHYIETANVAPLLGRQATLSVRLRRSSGMASNLALYVQKNATVDAGGGTGGWTTIDAVTITNANLPTGTTSADWYLAQLGVAIPNDGTANSLRIYILTASEPGNGSYWEMAQVQMELGYQTTAFSRAGGTIQGELAACQRYFVRWGGSSIYESIANAQANSTTGVSVYPVMPVQMRVAPTSVASNAVAFYDTVTVFAVNTPVLNTNINGTKMCQIGFSGASGLTQFRYGTLIANNSTSAYLDLSAEL